MFIEAENMLKALIIEEIAILVVNVKTRCKSYDF